jgi:hypothetical protein
MRKKHSKGPSEILVTHSLVVIERIFSCHFCGLIGTIRSTPLCSGAAPTCHAGVPGVAHHGCREDKIGIAHQREKMILPKVEQAIDKSEDRSMTRREHVVTFKLFASDARA